MNDDDVALDHFNQIILFQNGRYHVTLPWKSGYASGLSDNFPLAFGRMKSLARLLQHVDTQLLSRYDEIFKDQLRHGIIERVTEMESSSVNTLPHHPVLTPTKATTKVRIVLLDRPK